MKIQSLLPLSVRLAFGLMLLALFHFRTSAFAQGPLTPPGPPAPTMKSLDQIEPRTDINKLTGDATAVYVIPGPGSYYLSDDLNGAAGKDTIRIPTSSGRITIDLNGFALTTTGADRSAILTSSATDAVLIRNGMIICTGGTITKAVGGGGNRVMCDGLVVLGNVGTTVLALGDDSTVTGCRLTEGGISGGRRSAVRETRLQGANEFSVTLGDDSQIVAVQYAAGRGQLAVGNRGLIADCQVNVTTGPPSIFVNGVVVQTGAGAIVRNSTITGGSTVGNAMSVGANSLISGCRITTVFRDGIAASLTDNVTVESCVVQGNGRDGIILGANARVRDCSVTGSGTEGITVGENSIVTGCTVAGCAGTGIISSGENVEVSHCAIKGTTGPAGISLFSGSIADCNVTGTTSGPGILVNQRSLVLRNRSEGNGITGNLQPGLRVIGPNNRVENNQLVNNTSFGLDIVGAAAVGNLVTGNHLRGNNGGGAQLASIAGNAIGTTVSTANIATDTHPSANYVP